MFSRFFGQSKPQAEDDAESQIAEEGENVGNESQASKPLQPN